MTAPSVGAVMVVFGGWPRLSMNSVLLAGVGSCWPPESTADVLNRCEHTVVIRFGQISRSDPHDRVVLALFGGEATMLMCPPANASAADRRRPDDQILDQRSH